MKWFSPGQSKGPVSVLDEAEQEVKEYSSLALNSLTHRLRDDRKYNILDLGPACGANVEFFSQFSCKIYIEDLHQTLTSFDYLSPEDGLGFDAVFRYLLPYQKNTRFDIILSWDLFNYLQRDELLHLVRHLTRFCRPGTLLLSLISTRKYIPEQPGTYKILNEQTLLYGTGSGIMKSCPLYQESDLGHMMPNFRACNSFLLRNGIKEYLLVCDKYGRQER